MAKVLLDMLGAIIGSVGKVSYYMRYSDNIARRKGAGGKSSNSPAAVEQRMKFGMLIQLATILQTIITQGFPQRKRGLSAANAFVSINKDICSVEGNVLTVDYEQLLCANGQLLTPEVTVTYSTENQKFSFKQTAPEEESNSNADDKVYAVLLESNQGLCRLKTLRQRGESGSTSIALPQRWEKEHVHVYVFATSADGKKASKSMYLTVEEGV